MSPYELEVEQVLEALQCFSDCDLYSVWSTALEIVQARMEHDEKQISLFELVAA